MNINKDDARNFILALNATAQYVPPIVMQQLLGNPICREIEAAANNPESTTPAQQAPTPERLRPVS